jgi:glyoxylase I family protein
MQEETKALPAAARPAAGFWGVRYQVKDVARSIEFYTKTLGFALDRRNPPAFAQVSLGDLKLILSGPGASGSRPMPDSRRQEPGGWNRLVLQVTDLPARVAGLKAKGVRFRNELETGPGGRQIQAEDPDGNPLELFEPAQELPTKEIKCFARLKIHPGKLDEFKRLNALCVESVCNKDTGTLQYESYFNSDQSECLVYERYRDSEALLEHTANLGGLMDEILETCSGSGEIAGTPSLELVKAVEGSPVQIFTPLGCALYQTAK